MLPACWKSNRLEKSVVQNNHQKFTPKIHTKDGWLKWLVKMVK
jgi:hypothetical protein